MQLSRHVLSPAACWMEALGFDVLMHADQLWRLPAEEQVQGGEHHPVQKAAGQHLKVR